MLHRTSLYCYTVGGLECDHTFEIDRLKLAGSLVTRRVIFRRIRRRGLLLLVGHTAWMRSGRIARPNFYWNFQTVKWIFSSLSLTSVGVFCIWFAWQFCLETWQALTLKGDRVIVCRMWHRTSLSSSPIRLQFLDVQDSAAYLFTEEWTFLYLSSRGSDLFSLRRLEWRDLNVSDTVHGSIREGDLIT
jgi:hypothetical protein